MQVFQGFLFDLDGVVVDTRPYHFQAWHRLARELGFELNAAHNEELRGLSRMGSLEKIIEWGGLYVTEAEKLHWADVKNNWYVSLIGRMKPDEVLPGVRLFLEESRAAGIKTALVSSSKNARAVLRSTQLDHLFDVVIDGNVAKKSKPAPDAFLLAAEGLRLLPTECLVFDDAPVGIEAARRGGFRCVAVGQHGHLCCTDWRIADFEQVDVAHIAHLLATPESTLA
jgi:beta-phosphoglucomutase